MSRSIESLSAELIGKPIAWPRTTVRLDSVGDVHQHNPKTYREWKRDAADKLQAFAGFRTFAGEVAVTVDVGPDRVAVNIAALDTEEGRRARTGLRGDLDNYGKAVLDALQAGGVLADDRQVSELIVRFRP